MGEFRLDSESKGKGVAIVVFYKPHWPLFRESQRGMRQEGRQLREEDGLG